MSSSQIKLLVLASAVGGCDPTRYMPRPDPACHTHPGHLGAPWGTLGHLGAPWGHLGAPWGTLGAPWGTLGAPWGTLGAPWGTLGAPWGTLGHLGAHSACCAQWAPSMPSLSAASPGPGCSDQGKCYTHPLLMHLVRPVHTALTRGSAVLTPCSCTWCAQYMLAAMLPCPCTRPQRPALTSACLGNRSTRCV